MDLRTASQEIQIRELIDRMLMKVNTCVPGEIIDFDPATQTATIAPAIRMKTFIDETEGYIDLPPLVNVPVIVSCAVVKGFSITFPISAGDSCLLIFSQRAIDNWHDHGGIQNPEAGVGSRHHDLTDAFALLTPLPLPLVLSDYEGDGIEIRNSDKDSRITVKDDSIEVVQGEVSLLVETSGVTITGDLYVTGNVSDAKGSMEEMREAYNSHSGHPGTPSPQME